VQKQNNLVIPAQAGIQASDMPTHESYMRQIQPELDSRILSKYPLLCNDLRGRE
jgi:hypothetical protein